MITERIQIDETNILLKTDLINHGLQNFILRQRMELINYIRKNKDFMISFEPVEVEEAPLIVKIMAEAGEIADVGPMAAVAGTISEVSMQFLVNKGVKYAIVENGGDIAIKTNKDVIMGLYAGTSSLSGQIGFKIKHDKTPMGICTSSGTVGPSISLGRADSVTVFADRASTADALATSIANEAKGELDSEAVQSCLTRAEDFKEYFRGVMVIVGESAGTIGKIPKLIKTDKKAVLGDFFELY
ncbi:MAG: UPF0280 family protein [Methanobacterium sp.]|uniref:UPF0280 family protein n=1 Tax=Methanobacterium sp. TaxID=2164 RepID=UPI003D65AE04|nr:UPF0280 family protein [Methanobacterium sp.]